MCSLHPKQLQQNTTSVESNQIHNKTTEQNTLRTALEIQWHLTADLSFGFFLFHPHVNSFSFSKSISNMCHISHIDPGVLFQFPEDFSDEVNSGWPQVTVDTAGVVEVQTKYTQVNNVMVKSQTGSQNQLPQGTLALASGPWVVASCLLEVDVFGLFSFLPPLHQ